MSIFPCRPWLKVKCYTSESEGVGRQFDLPDEVSLDELKAEVQQEYGNEYRIYFFEFGTIRRLRNEQDFKNLISQSENSEIELLLKRSRSITRSKSPPKTLFLPEKEKGRSISPIHQRTGSNDSSSSKNSSPFEFNRSLSNRRSSSGPREFTKQRGHRRTRSGVTTYRPWVKVKISYQGIRREFDLPDEVSLDELRAEVEQEYGNEVRIYYFRSDYGTFRYLGTDHDFKSLISQSTNNEVELHLRRKKSEKHSQSPLALDNKISFPTTPKIRPPDKNPVSRTVSEQIKPHATRHRRNLSGGNDFPKKSAFSKGHRRTRSGTCSPAYLVGAPHSTDGSNTPYSDGSITPDQPRIKSNSVIEGGGMFIPDDESSSSKFPVTLRGFMATPDSGFQSPDSKHDSFESVMSPFGSESSRSSFSRADSVHIPPHLLEEVPDDFSVKHNTSSSITQKIQQLQVSTDTIAPPENYKIGKLVGSGGFAKVYYCLDHDTGRDLAVKQVEYDLDCKDSRSELKALQNEIKILKKLRHPHIVLYYGTNEQQGFFNIFMEYITGGSLRSYIQKNGPLSEKLTRKYVFHILLGLEYLHSQKIVHRDIKAANVLRDSSGNAKLADFGASKRLHTLMSLSGFKTVVGSPYWMSPEVIQSQGGYGRKVDVWSVGATIVELLTGSPPWYHLEPVAAMFQIASKPTPHNLPDFVSQEMKGFVEVCLTFEPKERPYVNKVIAHPMLSEFRKKARD